MSTVPLTFTVHISRDAILQIAKDKVVQVDRALRDRAISQTVASFIVCVSFALIHVSVGALKVDLVEKAQPIAHRRNGTEWQMHSRGVEELVPGCVGTLFACCVFIPLIRMMMREGSSQKQHLWGLGISFLMNMLWCGWFAVLAGYYSNEVDGVVDALDLVLAIINFVFMIVNVLSSSKAYRKSKEATAEQPEKK